MAGELSPMAAKILAKPRHVPFKMVGIDHVVLLVTDMEKAMHFYTTVLGCRPGYSYPDIAMEQVWCGTELIVLIDTSQPNAKYAQPEIKGGRNMDHVCLAIGPYDADALLAHFEKHDVEIVQQATHGGARGMGHATYVRDPFGNKIELKGPPLI